MLTMQTNEPRIQITRYALQDITAWLGDEMPRFAREELATFGVKLVGALAVAGVLTVIMFGVVLRFFIDLGVFVFLIPVIIFTVGFVVQAFVHHKAHGVMLIDGKRIRFEDEHSYMKGSEDDLLSQFFRWALVPAWLFFSAFDSLAKAWRLHRADPALCAEIAAGLAAVDRRVPIPEIEHQYRDERLVQTVRALLSFPGVLVSSREYPCLLLSKELGDTLRQML